MHSCPIPPELSPAAAGRIRSWLESGGLGEGDPTTLKAPRQEGLGRATTGPARSVRAGRGKQHGAEGSVPSGIHEGVQTREEGAENPTAGLEEVRQKSDQRGSINRVRARGFALLGVKN